MHTCYFCKRICFCDGDDTDNFQPSDCTHFQMIDCEDPDYGYDDLGDE